MAQSLSEDLIAEALLEAIDRNREAIAEKARAAGQWLREQAEPPEGVELRAPDGSVYTGLVVVERNEAVLMLAVKHPTLAARPAPAPVAPSSYQASSLQPEQPYQSSYQQHHAQLWPEDDEDPYRR